MREKDGQNNCVSRNKAKEYGYDKLVGVVSHHVGLFNARQFQNVLTEGPVEEGEGTEEEREVAQLEHGHQLRALNSE
jgi:hypothetical protein